MTKQSSSRSSNECKRCAGGFSRRLAIWPSGIDTRLVRHKLEYTWKQTAEETIEEFGGADNRAKQQNSQGSGQ